MLEITFMSQTLSVLFLLVISSFTYILSKKINFPYTVLLVLVGLLLIPISGLEYFYFIDDFKLSPDLLFYVFLPILLFEASYNIDYRRLFKNWKTIGILSIFGLIFSSFLIGGLLFYITGFISYNIPFLVCLLFGIIISATDPIAVLSIFKSIGAPRRLTLLFEGESLFNDGTAVVLFMIVLGIILGGGVVNDTIFFEGIMTFTLTLFGSIVFGIFSGLLFTKIIGSIINNEDVEIVLTIVLAHLTFIGAEIISQKFDFIYLSGVISTVVAAIVIGNYGKYNITARVEKHMIKIWEFFVFVVNSLVFILMGLILRDINVDFSGFAFLIFIVILILLISRVIVVFSSIGIVNFFKIEQKIPTSWGILMSWGSLRGALALMMVLMIPGIGDPSYERILLFQELVGWNYDYSIKEFLLILTIGSIMFTLFVKAPMTSYVLKDLKIHYLHKLEKFKYYFARILSNTQIISKIDISTKKAYITNIESKLLLNKYQNRLERSKMHLSDVLGKSSEAFIKKSITLFALGIEKKYLKDMFYYNELNEKNFKYLLRKIESEMEKVEYNQLSLENISSSKHKSSNILSRFENWIYDKNYDFKDLYLINRTRLIVTRKVINELKSISQIDLPFPKQHFEDVINVYSDLSKKADKKRLELFIQYKDKINEFESYLVNKSLIKLEENIIRDLYSKESITPKLYLRFKKIIEKDMYSNYK